MQYANVAIQVAGEVTPSKSQYAPSGTRKPSHKIPRLIGKVLEDQLLGKIIDPRDFRGRRLRVRGKMPMLVIKPFVQDATGVQSLVMITRLG